MPVDTNLSSLVINKLTTAQYQELVENDQVNENELYLTTDSSYPTEQEMNDALAGKQDTLTTNQLDAVNSGITSALVTQIGTNQTDISTLSSIVSNKADVATTLAGYGITNAYTKTEVDVELNNKQNILTAGDNITIVEETSNIEGDTSKYYSYYSGNTVDDGNGNYVILQNLGASNKYLRTTSNFGGSYSLSQFTDPSSTSLTGLKIKFKLKELPVVDDTFSSIVGGAYANFPKTNIKISYNVTNDIITFTNEYYGSSGDSASVMGTYVITDASSKLLNQWHTLNLYKDNNVWHINVDDLGTETVDNSGLYLGVTSWGYFFICNAYSANNNQSATNGYFIYDIDLLGTGIYRDNNLVLKLTTDGNITGTIISATVPNYTAGTGINITNNTISVASPTLTNTSTGSGSLTISGTSASDASVTNVGVSSSASGSFGSSFGWGSSASGNYSTAVGAQSTAYFYSAAFGYGSTASSQNTTSIGPSSTASAYDAIALGHNAKATKESAIQIGNGTNSEDKTMYVGALINNTNRNYKLLDLTTGKIPVDRLPSTAPSIDNVTITENSSNELQASAVMNAKTNVDSMPVWEGTESEWTNGKATDWYNWKTDVSINNSSSIGNLKTGGNSPEKVLYGNGVYICPMNFGSGAGSTANYKYSADGINWVTKTLPGTVQDISFGNGIFFAAKAYSTDIYVSTDGENWNTISLGYQIEGNAISCTFANGICYIIPYSSDNSWFYSTDGENWVHMTTVFYGNEVIYGNNEYISFGAGNTYLYKSQDGINNWTGVYIYDKISMIGDLVYGNGVYVDRGVNSENTCYVSNDCITWTYIDRIGSSNSGDLTFEGGLFLWPQSFSNGAQTVYYSSNGSDWKYTTNSQTEASYTCRVVNGSLYLLGSNTCFRAILGQSQVYTLDATPTVSSDVYSEPSTLSALTISSVGTGTITLSDSNTYTYTQSGDVTTYETVGDAYPTYLANIEGVGVKKGNTLIANYSTQEQADWAQSDTSAVDYIKNKPDLTASTLTLEGSSGRILLNTNSEYPQIVMNTTNGTNGIFQILSNGTVSFNRTLSASNFTVNSETPAGMYNLYVPTAYWLRYEYPDDSSLVYNFDTYHLETKGIKNTETTSTSDTLHIWEGTQSEYDRDAAVRVKNWYGWKGTPSTYTMQTESETPAVGELAWNPTHTGRSFAISETGTDETGYWFKLTASGDNVYYRDTSLDEQETLESLTSNDLCFIEGVGVKTGTGVDIANLSSSSTTAEEIVNANETAGAVSPLKIWQGTQSEWTNGKATDWYNWVTPKAISSKNFTLVNGIEDDTNFTLTCPAASSSTYAYLSPTITETVNSFSTVVKIKTSSNWAVTGTGCYIQNWAGTSTSYPYPGLMLYCYDGIARLTMYQNGTTYHSTLNLASLSSDTWYWFKYEQTGTSSYSMSYSEDGETFINIGSGTGVLTKPASPKCTLYQYTTGSSAQRDFVYDLSECSLTVNDTQYGFYTFTQNEVYTTDTTPTTTSTVYSEPNTTSTLTVTSTDTDTITLSDNNTYTYTPSGNQVTYQTIGDAYPNYLANINGVGVKVGNTLVADYTTLDNVPTQGSTNGITSGAVYTVLGDLETALHNFNSGTSE